MPLETYIPSEKLAIEFTNGSEHMEVLKSHLCKQRNIKLVKLPFKTTETEAEYADRVKAVFKSVHIFIYSDVEADVSVIRAKFNEARYTTVNDIYELWKDLKRGLKNNTFENYKYMYETFVRHQIGSKTVSSLRKTDIKRFYNYLADERHLKPATIDNVHTVLHQILDMAVDDDYIRNNPSNNVLKELKQSHCFQTEKRRALTKPEQELFLDYLKNSPTSKYWYPVFAVMIGTGLRVGEVTGLRWCDIDFEEGIIDVNHTLVYYDHRTEGSKRGCYFNVNTTKTPAGRRKVPMLGFVKEAFLMEKERQELLDLHCEATVDGYTDFIFINRFGQPQHQATLNKAIRRIIRDCNDEQLLKDENAEVLLPHFSCHSLRHTFTTRMCEAGVNVKVIQDTLGHKDISTTLNIYTDVTKELRKSEFEGLDSYFKNEYNKMSV
ncbi:MAG: tyrosine-type recombinase/integrase [Candidatus Limivicinus sp.]|nr:tyrosine-type recombinase/integrase [Candidatus Limivicinus sp.]